MVQSMKKKKESVLCNLYSEQNKAKQIDVLIFITVAKHLEN